MSIIRKARPESNFYILDKKISEDSRLSWAARGLLIFLLGKPDNWKVSIEHLRKETEASDKATGRDGIYSLLKALIAAGYVKRVESRNEDGTLDGADYLVFDDPIPTDGGNFSPLPAFPDTDEPCAAKTTLISIEVKQGLKENKNMSGRPDDAPELLDYLNKKTGQHYRPVPSNLSLLQARLKEGATPEDIRAVIDHKCFEWQNDPKMSQYLRPKTLFAASNFNQYVGQLPDTKTVDMFEPEEGVTFVPGVGKVY